MLHLGNFDTDPEQMDRFNRVFEYIDEDNSNTISIEEFNNWV